MPANRGQQKSEDASPQSANGLSRRSFASGVVVAVANSLLSGSASARNGSMHSDPNPNAPPMGTVGLSEDGPAALLGEAARKFSADGTVLPFAGNTVICRTPPQGLLSDKLRALHEALRNVSLRSKLALVPPESYHMTMFSGANDQNREASHWPAGVPLTVTIEECNRAVAERLTTFRLRAELPFRLKIASEEVRGYPTTCSLRLAGADEAAERNLRNVRRQLAVVYGCRLPTPDVYSFHITIAYCLRSFSKEEFGEYRSIMNSHRNSIAGALPVVEFGLPEFCTFPDMKQYDFQCYLRSVSV